MGTCPIDTYPGSQPYGGTRADTTGQFPRRGSALLVWLEGCPTRDARLEQWAPIPHTVGRLPKAVLKITAPKGTQKPERKGKSMKKRFLLGAMLLGVVAVLLSALSLQTRAAQAAPSSGGSFQPRVNSASCGKWSVVPSPNGNGSSGLNSLAVVSANALWAVGNVSDPQTRVQTTLIEYWNGTQWHIVSNPNPSPEFNNFYGVAAISENDTWAVGFYANSVGIAQTLIEHWDGSTWSVVSSPNAGSQGNELLGVAAVSADDVWAVGFAATSNGDQKALIEHWNGHELACRAQPSSKLS